jgi:hypothetical protein
MEEDFQPVMVARLDIFSKNATGIQFWYSGRQ